MYKNTSYQLLCDLLKSHSYWTRILYSCIRSPRFVLISKPVHPNFFYFFIFHTPKFQDNPSYASPLFTLLLFFHTDDTNSNWGLTKVGYIFLHKFKSIYLKAFPSVLIITPRSLSTSVVLSTSFSSFFSFTSNSLVIFSICHYQRLIV